MGREGLPASPKTVQCMSAAFTPVWQRVLGYRMEGVCGEWPAGDSATGRDSGIPSAESRSHPLSPGHCGVMPRQQGDMGGGGPDGVLGSLWLMGFTWMVLVRTGMETPPGSAMAPQVLGVAEGWIWGLERSGGPRRSPGGRLARWARAWMGSGPLGGMGRRGLGQAGRCGAGRAVRGSALPRP